MTIGSLIGWLIALLLSASTPSTPASTPQVLRIHGDATWYDWRVGEAAAGPELRRWLGKGWRYQWVKVCAQGACVQVQLTDWCLCSSGDRVIDLDRRSFASLARPSRGVIHVTIERMNP